VLWVHRPNSSQIVSHAVCVNRVIKCWTEANNSKDESCYAKDNPSLDRLSNQVPHLSGAMFSPSPAITLPTLYNHLNRRIAAVLLFQGANQYGRRSHWSRCLRRGSAAAQLLGLRVRIPARHVCLSVSCECCVLSGRGLCVWLITRPEESYWIWHVWVWSGNLSDDEA